MLKKNIKNGNLPKKTGYRMKTSNHFSNSAGESKNQDSYPTPPLSQYEEKLSDIRPELKNYCPYPITGEVTLTQQRTYKSDQYETQDDLKGIQKMPTLIVGCGIETPLSLWIDRFFEKNNKTSNKLYILDLSENVHLIWRYLLESITKINKDPTIENNQKPIEAYKAFRSSFKEWRFKVFLKYKESQELLKNGVVKYEKFSEYSRLHNILESTLFSIRRMNEIYAKIYFTEQNWPALTALVNNCYFYYIDWTNHQKFHPALDKLKTSYPNHLRVFYTSCMYHKNFNYSNDNGEKQKTFLDNAVNALQAHVTVDVFSGTNNPHCEPIYKRLFRIGSNGKFDLSEHGLRDYPLVPYIQQARRSQYLLQIKDTMENDLLSELNSSDNSTRTMER